MSRHYKKAAHGTSSSRLAAWALAGALAFIASQALSATPAYASNFGSTACSGSPRNCVSLADNATHQWCPEGTLGNQIYGIYSMWVSAMQEYDAYTDLTTSYVCPITSNRDVIVTDYSYGANGLQAWTECLPGSATSGSDPNRKCDQQKVRLNGYSGYLYMFDTDQKMRSVSCHEIGHTVGLRHSTESTSCMVNPYNASRSDNTSAHDDSMINSHY